VARILLGRSNSWLVTMNFASLALALYVCCFINFPQLIAEYNVEHRWDQAKMGVTLDVQYLAGLGPQAIPALDRVFKENFAIPPAAQQRDQMALAHRNRMQDWRGWTYRDWQLMQYLQRQDVLRP